MHYNLWCTVFINHNNLWCTVKINHNLKFINVYDSFINYENLIYKTVDVSFTPASSLRSSFSIYRAQHRETCRFGPCHRVQASMWFRHTQLLYHKILKVMIRIQNLRKTTFIPGIHTRARIMHNVEGDVFANYIGT